MNNRQRFNILTAIATQVAIAAASFGGIPALADDQEDLFHLCSRFPLNSQCEGYEAPIPLDDRLGEEANCLLSGAEDAEDCKLLLGEDNLTVYVEFGEDLDVLGDEKDTTEVIIPLSSIQSFEYSEDSRVDVGAVVAFGLPGLFAKKNTATFNLRYTPEAVETDEIVDTGEEIEPDPVEADAEETAISEQPSQQLLFEMGRGRGREMRQQLEEITGLTAERTSVD